MIAISPASPLALFGCGNMGRAMLDGWLAAGFDPRCFVVIDPHTHDLPEGVALYDSVGDADGPFAAVMLGIKPQLFESISADIAQAVTNDGLVLSLLAGTRSDALEAAFPGRDIVRIMPNLAAALGKAPIGIFAANRAHLEAPLTVLFAPLGLPIWIDDEEQMDAVTALAGSGPAFVYRFVDALAKAGAELGLGAEQATAMAMAMVEGAAILAAHSKDSPAELAAKVTSPGGTTAAGLAVLDTENALQALVTDTLRAARDRGVELAGPQR